MKGRTERPASAAARTVGSTVLQSGSAPSLDCTAAQLIATRTLSTPPPASVRAVSPLGASVATTPQTPAGSEAAEAAPGSPSAAMDRARISAIECLKVPQQQ